MADLRRIRLLYLATVGLAILGVILTLLARLGERA